MARPDVIIVGAGIVGAACARAAALAGLSVSVIDRNGIAGGATSAAMGHLVVMDDSEAQFQLTRRSVELWRMLRAELPASVEFDPAGTMWAAADEEEMREVRRKAEYYGARGVEAQVLDPGQLREAEPNLRPGMAGGLRVPGDSVLYPPAAARWMLERSGARLIADHVVEIAPGQVRLKSGERLSCSHIVNATGVAAGRLSTTPEILPRKGHLLITDRYPGFARHQIIELGYLKSAHGAVGDSVAFNIQPRATGQMLIGSSRQYGTIDPAVDQAILRRMLDRAIQYMPRLAELSAIRVWTGFRPATADKLPVIGRTAESSRLLVAAGHEGLGITTSLATAELIAAEILGQGPAIDPGPYLPTRG